MPSLRPYFDRLSLNVTTLMLLKSRILFDYVINYDAAEYVSCFRGIQKYAVAVFLLNFMIGQKWT